MYYYFKQKIRGKVNYYDIYCAIIMPIWEGNHLHIGVVLNIYDSDQLNHLKQKRKVI
jgi:hypothetical protein